MPGLLWDRSWCLTAAQGIGPATAQVTQQWLADPVVERLPTVRRLLHLAERFGASRLEAASARALAFADPRYGTIKRILEQGHERQAAAAALHYPPAKAFVRSAAELLGHLFGGATWN